MSTAVQTQSTFFHMYSFKLFFAECQVNSSILIHNIIDDAHCILWQAENLFQLVVLQKLLSLVYVNISVRWVVYGGSVERILRSAGKDLTLSKLRRLSQPDAALGAGLTYTFVDDNHVFSTEGATLRYVTFVSVAIVALRNCMHCTMWNCCEQVPFASVKHDTLLCLKDHNYGGLQKLF